MNVMQSPSSQGQQQLEVTHVLHVAAVLTLPLAPQFDKSTVAC